MAKIHRCNSVGLITAGLIMVIVTVYVLPLWYIICWESMIDCTRWRAQHIKLLEQVIDTVHDVPGEVFLTQIFRYFGKESR